MIFYKIWIVSEKASELQVLAMLLNEIVTGKR